MISTSDYSFSISTGSQTLELRDEDLKKNEDWKIIIDLRPLDLQHYNKTGTMPTEFEFPLDVLEYRKEKRRLNALANGAIFIDSKVNPNRYFYINGEKLRVLQGDKVAIVEEIEIIYGKQAVKVDGLELGHPYIKLPVEVARHFETILKYKKEREFSLVLRGKSMLDGRKYYGFNTEPPAEKWNRVKDGLKISARMTKP